MSKSIAVVILNYNNWRDTLACAESVLNGEVKPNWLFIVDNASTNDSMHWIRRWASGNLDFTPSEHGSLTCVPKPLKFKELDMTKCQANSHEASIKTDAENFRAAIFKLASNESGNMFLIRNSANRGYAAGNNLGISAAMQLGADAVWILNNDTIATPNALKAMRDRLFSKLRPGLCGASLKYMGTDIMQCRAGGIANPWTGLSALDGYQQPYSKALIDPPETIEKRINFIYGACVMASSDFIKSVGLMDERYFLYCEEQDWAYSAKGKFDFAYAPDAVLYHKEGGSTGFSSHKTNLRSLWHLTRSRILLTAKHVPWALPTVCLYILFAAACLMWRRMIVRPFCRWFRARAK